MNHYLLTIYSLVFFRTQHSAKLILSAEKSDCNPEGCDSTNDFTCLPCPLAITHPNQLLLQIAVQFGTYLGRKDLEALVWKESTSTE